ncbi:MAG TPA: heliorhodopsin HeR [Candidatus Saccharimonadales bacterium]|nr:heliorhodopsin HeR [Candidatus Saccharimonadales bacterium]
MSKIIDAKLLGFNRIMAVVHFAQGILVLILSRQFSLPIKTDYLFYNQSTRSLEASQHVLFNLSLPALIAAFFFVSALAHLFIGTVYSKTYTRNLSKGINKARWVEYSVSASIMIVAVSLLVGIYDIAILAGAFALTAIMNLMGLVMEVHNQTTEKINWLSYWIGTFAGLVPWAIIAFYFWASDQYGNASPPTFVYWIFVSIFLFFSCFALNMVLQYKKTGKWRDYRYGELVYIWLSLIAKSALAWQVFAGTLRP